MLNLILIGLGLVVAAAGGLYFYFRRRRRKELIALLTDKVDLLAHWTYTPAEWQKAVEEEFTWASSKDYGGEVYISPLAVYVKADTRDHLIDLTEKGKVVTNASFTGTVGMPLKLRVRWRVRTYHETAGSDRTDQFKYFKEDYRIPVPLAAKEEARKVVDFFTTRLENNLEAYTAVVGDDEAISLFGKDTF